MVDYNIVNYQTLTGESDSFSTTVDGPVSKYKAYAVTVNKGFQTLIDNDVYLNNHLTNLVTHNNPYLEDQTICIPMSSAVWNGNSTAYDVGNWEYEYGNLTGRSPTTSGDHIAYIDINYPQAIGVYVKEIIVTCSHPGATVLPSTMPKVKICVFNGTETELVTVTDHASDLSTYQAVHNFRTTFNFTYFRGYRYYLKVYNEYGTDTSAGLTFHNIQMRFGSSTV